METALLTLTCIALLVFIGLILLLGRRVFSCWSLLVLFFGIYFADNFIILLTNRFSQLQFIPNRVWEGFLICGWSGKLYSILFALALLPFVQAILTRQEVGLIGRQQAGSLLPSCMVVLALSAWALYVGISSPKGKSDLDTILYLTVMPGLNEELIYRGYLLGLLDKLMPGKTTLMAAPIGWGVVVTSLLFGLLHGFWLDGSLSIHLEIIALRNAAISGFIFAWLKNRTGSLLVPVVAHGLEDFLFFLPRML